MLFRPQSTWAAGIAGFALGAAGAWLFFPSATRFADAQLTPAITLEGLAAELAELRGRLPDQAHVMADVGHHFANLWFAGQAANWPLAEFNLAETKSHLRWAVRIIPKRKVGENEVDLAAILEAMENSPLARLGEAIAARDAQAFESAYRFTLETCYACHKASDKAFLKLRIPQTPDAPILNFDPQADLAALGASFPW
ncbi:MAG: hypothetical protein U0836_22930 [Pirellulales bacterium]